MVNWQDPEIQLFCARAYFERRVQAAILTLEPASDVSIFVAVICVGCYL